MFDFSHVLFISFLRLASQSAHFPATAFDEFYMKGDAGLASEVPTTMDNSQMIQNPGFNNQGMIPVNSVSLDNSTGIQMNHCGVGQSPNGGLYDTSATRQQNTIPSTAEVW